MKSALQEQAHHDFNRVRWKEIISRVMRFTDPESRAMISLQEIKELLRPKSETYLGMRVVPVSKIIGSEGRYRDFSRRFLPRYEYLRSRWMRVDQAHLSDVILPPIKLYEIGGVYFVRDGNHRVSVAKAKGVEAIDAEVVSLNSQLQLSPDMNRDDILKEVVGWEQRTFFEKTGYNELFPADELMFSVTGRYDEIVEHILVHKYFINQGCKEEISFKTALISWYANVFKPVINIIRSERILSRFPGRTPADLYVWIIRHWDALKDKYGPAYPLEQAAIDYAHRYGKGLWAQFLDFVYRFYLTIVRRDKV